MRAGQYGFCSLFRGLDAGGDDLGGGVRLVDDSAHLANQAGPVSEKSGGSVDVGEDVVGSDLSRQQGLSGAEDRGDADRGSLLNQFRGQGEVLPGARDFESSSLGFCRRPRFASVDPKATAQELPLSSQS